MIQITKEEKDIIREELPLVHIVRTCKQKSKRHHYYCVEEPAAVRLIRKMRGWEVEPKRKGRGKRDR